MKIGVISDTHYTAKSPGMPKAVLEGLKGVDMIIHAGDLTSLKVLEELRKICPNVKSVYGNMDPPEVRVALAEKEIIQADNLRLGVYHGYGGADSLIDVLDEFFKDDKPDIIIFGHSHTAFSRKIGGVLYFNPGSPTDKIFAPYNSYGIIEIKDSGIKARIVRI